MRGRDTGTIGGTEGGRKEEGRNTGIEGGTKKPWHEGRGKGERKIKDKITRISCCEYNGIFP